MKRRSQVTLLVVAALIAGVVAPSAAIAGPGSIVSGIVWADTNRDGVRQPTEPARAGVTVQLLTAPGGAVAATTTTNASGAYSFANAADGDYIVRVDAPGAFVFPATATGQNDFVREGQPLPGQPERGVTAAFPITGAGQVTGVDAGMQPIATLQLARLPMADACEGFARTGTPPFDATDGPGLDSSSANCIVRTGDTVMQQYGVSLTGLPTGTSVPNVVVEFRVSSPDGARLALVGPGVNGIPSECLTAATGANPPSSRTINADGSITVRCNVGTLSSTAAGIPLSYEMTEASPIPSHALIEAVAYAGGGDAGVSSPVAGPIVEVTGRADWDLVKNLYPTNQYHQAGPDYRAIEVAGVGTLEGYVVRYQFDIRDLTDGLGGGQLQWPVTFTDVMPDFPNARILECRNTNLSDRAGRSFWTLGCPAVTETQGADGWQLSISPNFASNPDLTEGHMVMTVFLPVDEMNRAIDPSWQPGDPFATGDVVFDNVAAGTDHWTMNGGQPNTGEDPANNTATVTGAAAAPRWDLVKDVSNTITFAERQIDGVPTEGYDVLFALTVIDLAGAGNIAPWLDRPVAFKDRFVSHPGSYLIECTQRAVGTGGATATPTCETGLQPAEGWDMSLVPTEWGLESRRGDFWARVFIPMDAMELDPCAAANPQLHVRNEAIDSNGWTAGGAPNYNFGTGFEPGWDGTVATGNNLVNRTINVPPAACGTLAGDKGYFRVAGQAPITPAFAGHIVGSQVLATANNDRVRVPNFQLCDVFDVSVFRLTGEAWMLERPEWPNPGAYVIEYAVGPNEVDTQAGPITGGLYPINSSSVRTAATQCRDDGTIAWSSDPGADFGPAWQDSVNMVRMRPIDPAHVEVGPFSAHLQMHLQVRESYNGGPNAGEQIPTGVRLTNVGGWPTGRTGSSWNTVAREITFSGMLLGVAKSVTPTQYLPGTSPVWDLSVSIDRATIGSTMRNLRIVDTLPADLHFDLPCTQGLLPAGVAVSYDSQTRRVTFQAGDIPLVNAPTQVVFGPNANATHGRLRICTTIDSLAQPGDTHVNRVQALADNAENAPTAQATIQVVGSGQLGITKAVDKPFVASGEDYTWSLDWGNTSTSISFLAPDVIDVLPWNGDGDPASGSARSQFPSEYTGLAQLTGPLTAPTYIRGGTGAVAGAWFYSTADPSTITHDPRSPANADPAAPGGLWQTEGEIAAGAGFGAVTAIRFVSGSALPVQSRVRAVVGAVSTSNDLDNVYVNRAMIFSPSFPDQPLLSNEPYVLMPGFTLGDLVWIDRNGNGRFDAGEQGVAGVTVQVMDDTGSVVATRVTDADGRWSAAALPAGTYTAHIPPSMFADGAPLAEHLVRLVASRPDQDVNENADNNNTASPDPTVTGLTSTPVTLAYIYDDGLLESGNGPLGDNVAGLGSDIIPDVFTNFTVDLALMPAPGIDIEKATNGQDADTVSGPAVTVGGDVRWTYVVTNTGGVDLTNVTVTDDVVDDSTIDCDGTGGNLVPGPVAPEASFTCVATGTATAGQYANTGTVTGLDPTQVEVTDEDPSHYFGVQPAIDIEKATNGQDADTPTGPLVTVGGAVRWTYVITNTGNAALTNVTVTDDQVPAADIDCEGTGGNVIAGPLEPEASFTCVATGTATAGQYANTGTVIGTGPVTTDVDGDTVAGAEVTDADPSHYFGVQPAVDIEKATNGQDADTAPGVQTYDGAVVTWTYAVTNTGNAPLTNVTVTDDMLAAGDIDCDGTGSNVVPGPLAAGGTFECVATGTAVRGQYANLGTVVGTGPETTDVDGEPEAGDEVTDDDPSHYFGHFGAIDIEKSTNGEDADEPTGPYVPVGGGVEWTYVVTNTGTVDLSDVTVTDDMVAATEIDCAGTGSNVIPGPLAPEASFTCVATGTAIAGQYANMSDVIGEAPDLPNPDDPEQPFTVTDDDPSHYFGAAPAVDIEKATNGHDADTAPGVALGVGAVVEWTYVVTNTGNVPLTDVTVTDDRVAASEIWCAGSPSNVVAGPLAPGESFTCNALGVAVAGPYANTGSVTANVPSVGGAVTDDDPSHYLASAPAGLPVTGAALPIVTLAAGTLLSLLGLLLVAATRRRRT
ncbi:DUF7507 domain-containing protein [Microbacterium cremeum]|uniref:DUF7507 domain-containing protein n=1 Tax=Microbacterium cremeum TaxID=2782169 RepID=UPI0018887769|nr:SdrD B-like domain-containing protein [Microbacterium cremeum]